MKKIILILLAIFMTGCTVNYTIEIKDNKIIETFDAQETDIERANQKKEDGKSFQDYVTMYKGSENIYSDYDMVFSNEACTENCKYYKIDGIVDNNEIALILTDDFTFESYANSTLGNEYISAFSVFYDDNKLTIEGKIPENIFNDYEILDDINIKVKTEYEVLTTNAEKTGENEYTWNVTKSNKGKKLYITLNTKEKSSDTQKEENSKIKITILLIVLLVILCISFISYSLSIKKKNINRL